VVLAANSNVQIADNERQRTIERLEGELETALRRNDQMKSVSSQLAKVRLSKKTTF